MLIKYHTKNDSLTILDIKQNLVEIYASHTNKLALYYILLKNNKKTIMQDVIGEKKRMEDLIMSDEYYTTFIDIYLLYIKE